jgi:hypothetical protein
MTRTCGCCDEHGVRCDAAPGVYQATVAEFLLSGFFRDLRRHACHMAGATFFTT